MRTKWIIRSFKLIPIFLLWQAVNGGAQIVQTLCSFNGTNGANPLAALATGDDGNFYGTTESGGSYGYGTVFQVTTNGTLNSLFSFNMSTGPYPAAALILGSDNNFYGTTTFCGSSGNGTVLRFVLAPVLGIQASAGGPELNLSGPLGHDYGVLFSTNLTGSNWANLLWVTNLSASPYSFFDPTGDAQPARFYRAFIQ